MNRNRYMFGLGTVGRDMVVTLISMYLMFYLTDVLDISVGTLAAVTPIMVGIRIFDGVNDPFMGLFVDNTRSRWGRFKPWMAIGAVLFGIFSILMFTDFGLTGSSFLIVFTVTYLLWEISFTANDIAYWSMLPSLSRDQKVRESIGSFARICANIGLFTAVVALVPATGFLTEKLGSASRAWTVLAIILVLVMWFFQAFTLFGVREELSVDEASPRTRLRDLFRVVFANDQLMWTAVSMTLFMVGYTTTTSFGLYYFKYVYGDENMYSLFALILGLSQIAALIVFPPFARRYSRRKLFGASTALVVLGYLVFFFAPSETMLWIGLAGVLMFVGQAFIQVLMLMFIADTVEYGQWKFGSRNDSVTFSVQPFIYKLGGAVSSGVVGYTLILSGMKAAETPADMTPRGLLIFKIAMMLLPLFLIVISYIVWRSRYKLDEKRYAEIVADLEAGRYAAADT